MSGQKDQETPEVSFRQSRAGTRAPSGERPTLLKLAKGQHRHV